VDRRPEHGAGGPLRELVLAAWPAVAHTAAAGASWGV